MLRAPHVAAPSETFERTLLEKRIAASETVREGEKRSFSPLCRTCGKTLTRGLPRLARNQQALELRLTGASRS
jgi:hypothetical protein